MKLTKWARAAGGERDADLLSCFILPIPGPCRTRVDDHDRRLPSSVTTPSGARTRTRSVVDRARQRAPVEHQLGVELEHVRESPWPSAPGDVAAPAQHVEEQDRPPPGVLDVPPTKPDCLRAIAVSIVIVRSAGYVTR